MACRGKLPGVSNACGAYLIDGNGTYRSLSGQPLGAALEGADASGGGLAIGSRLEAMWSQRGAEAWPLRFEAGMDTVGSRGAAPRSTSRSAMAHAPLPIGARPSVPPRPDPNLAGIDDPVYKPLVPPPPPYGMQPLGLDQTQFLGRGVTLKPVPPVASGGFYAPSSSGAVVAPLPGSAQTQYVPPLPAPQETCLVNGFDPAWGEPPAAFNGLPLDFDAQMGAYTFDPNRREYVDALERYRTQQLEHTLHGGPPADPYLAQLAHWHSHLASQYRTGYMLQPYKSGNEPGWRTRWIPQRRAVSCRTD